MATYLDSSAIVKLAVHEPESQALRSYLRRRRPLLSSALARVEVLRALLPGGEAALARGRKVLARIDLVRVNDRILSSAGTLRPLELRSLDAVHLATANRVSGEIKAFVAYDARMAEAAIALGYRVVRPGL